MIKNKMKKIPLLIIIASFFLISCSKSKDYYAPHYSKNIKITASIDDSTDFSDTVFEIKDIISVYAWIGCPYAIPPFFVVYNSLNIYNCRYNWISKPPMIWYDKHTDHYFIGVYPHRKITNFIADNYTLDVCHQSASDLLIASNTSGISAEDEISVPLIFHHVLTRLTIKLNCNTKSSCTPVVNSVKIYANITGTINYIKKTVTATGTVCEVSIPATINNFTYSSVMLPQTIKKIVIQIDGTDYIYNNEQGIVLQEGKSILLPFNLLDNGELLLGNTSIIDWETVEDNDPENIAIEKD